jgi:hypothetical protein
MRPDIIKVERLEGREPEGASVVGMTKLSRRFLQIEHACKMRFSAVPAGSLVVKASRLGEEHLE